jgi:hypothetical protein
MKMKFAFDWGMSLEHNESLRQLARDLHASVLPKLPPN